MCEKDILEEYEAECMEQEAAAAEKIADISLRHAERRRKNRRKEGKVKFYKGLNKLFMELSHDQNFCRQARKSGIYTGHGIKMMMEARNFHSDNPPTDEWFWAETAVEFSFMGRTVKAIFWNKRFDICSVAGITAKERHRANTIIEKYREGNQCYEVRRRFAKDAKRRAIEEYIDIDKPIETQIGEA